MSQFSREQFAQRVIEIVRAKFPLVKIGRAEEPSFALRVNGRVEQLENLYRDAVLRPEHMQEQIEAWTLALLRVSEGMPDAIMSDFDEIRQRVMPVVVSQSNAETSVKSMISQPLVPGLRVAYAIDDKRTITYIPPTLFERWNVPIDDLHAIALENLVGRSEAIQANAAQDESGRINLILFQTLDGFDATRILLPTLHDRLREHLGSPFGAGIPNRDILLCFRNDDETVDRLRDQINKDYRQMPHQVTDMILQVTPDGIAPRD
jgi:uncharacterized protein YtpQ (UPF0354 family)